MSQPQPAKGAIRRWWSSHPMTYGVDHGTTAYVAADGSTREVEIGSREFFDLADDTFYSWNAPLHLAGQPFGRIFDYERCRGRQVLEVGCGMGCMAMNWALRGARITAVDLNPTAVAQTRRRFLQRGLPVRLCETDAESLPFPSSHFDHAYSWGVLHHTPGIQRAIDELYRVLKPGGTIGVMLYYRHSFLHQYVIRFVEGYLHAEREFLTPPQLSSRYGDGARLEGNPHTVPVTRAEVHEVLFRRFEQVRTEVFGTDVASILDQWLPGFGSRVLPRPLLDACARRWGWSLWIEAVKPQR